MAEAVLTAAVPLMAALHSADGLVQEGPLITDQITAAMAVAERGEEEEDSLLSVFFFLGEYLYSYM